MMWTLGFYMTSCSDMVTKSINNCHYISVFIIAIAIDLVIVFTSMIFLIVTIIVVGAKYSSFQALEWQLEARG